VTEDPREVGPLSGGVMSPGGSTPIRPITGRRSLPPPSFTRRPVGASRESLSPMGRATGLPRSVDVPGWGGPPLFAGGAASAPGEFGAPGPDHVPFWPERDSIFRSSSVTTFIAASRCVDPSTRSWSPTASMLAVATSARALVAILADEDTLSRGLGTPPLPEAHSPVGYCWQNSRCGQPLRGRRTATSTTSCRTLTTQISGPRSGSAGSPRSSKPLARQMRPRRLAPARSARSPPLALAGRRLLDRRRHVDQHSADLDRGQGARPHLVTPS
jgi:hypothetical protein